MITNAKRIVLLTLLLAWPLVATADDRRGGEVGFVVGGIAADDEMTRDTGETEIAVGLRGGSVLTRHLGWFVDGLYSKISTNTTRGEGRTTIGRTGIDLLFTPERDARWLVSFGAGWMVVDYENASAADFHNPLASLGFGQRIRVADNTRMRWELRVDQLLDDARLNEKLTQGMALLAVTWGPAGTVDRERQQASKDRDGDGVRDRHDRCPDTPPRAEVDQHGCAGDDDRDGIANGIDVCPRTRAGLNVGADGCPADADGDGVGDQTDACPATPAQAEVDEWGCPQDTDGDGVAEGIDRCPGSPQGARVDGSGCAADGDGDGVVEGLDRCPATPPDTPVDRLGCARDGDGDGVHDGLDACPETPSDTTVVDGRGCALADPVFERGQTALVLRGVRFESNSAALTHSSHGVLDEVAGSLTANPAVRVEIAGHTDSTGDATYNLDLSQRRAQAVRDYLIGRGIRRDRLEARGYGETQPIADNASRNGRSLNRRVELRKL